MTQQKSRPTIVCLCGSTRFMDAFHEAEKQETLAGKIVLTVSFKTSRSEEEVNTKLKGMVDELHLRKIELADEVLVLNVGGYIGESTAREIKWAETLCKKIRYLTDEEKYMPCGKGLTQ